MTALLRLSRGISFTMVGMIRFCSVMLVLIPALLAASRTQSSQSSPAPQQPSQAVPSIDGGAGSCSLELTLIDADAKPVYAAKVNVHIAYGFGGFRKLDLEASTNVDGKVRFTGLPAKVRNPPLVFHAAKDQMEGFANYDPASECQAAHNIVMKQQKLPAAQ